MNKILLVIKREYLVRVRKKSFIIMTILGPLLLAALMIAPIYLANQSQERRIIAVNQQTDFLLSDTELIHFVTIPDYEVDSLKKKFKNNQYYALLNIVNEEFTMYSDLQISLNVVRDIENQIEKIIELNNLKKASRKFSMLAYLVNYTVLQCTLAPFFVIFPASYSFFFY